MPSITIRNVPHEVHRALRVRAARHGRSIAAEMRAILEEAVKPPGRVKPGTMLTDIGRRFRLTDEELAAFERDKTPAKPEPFCESLLFLHRSHVCRSTATADSAVDLAGA